MTQRLLWASTGTKNAEYSDVKYIEALIGPETVNTVPRETLDAYRDHGAPEPGRQLALRGISSCRNSQCHCTRPARRQARRTRPRRPALQQPDVDLACAGSQVKA